MTIQNTINKTVSVDGKSYTQQTSKQGNSSIRRDVALPAAKAGSLTTRTDNTTGTLTMASGHGITTAAKLDIYWADPTTGNRLSRRNVTVGTVATNSVPFSGGLGDNLPVASTPITAQVPTIVDMRFDGDDLVVMVVTADAIATVVFTADDNAEDYAVVTTASGQVQEWYDGNGIANPLVGDTETLIHVSQGDSAAGHTVRVAVALT